MISRHIHITWGRHQMETLSALLALCAGNSQLTGEFPAQRPVKRSFVGFFDLRLNKHLSEQSWGWWFETPSDPLWRHCNPPRRDFLSYENLQRVITAFCMFGVTLWWILCIIEFRAWIYNYRADSRFAPSHWKTTLHCNDVCHWLGASLESALLLYPFKTMGCNY